MSLELDFLVIAKFGIIIIITPLKHQHKCFIFTAVEMSKIKCVVLFCLSTQAVCSKESIPQILLFALANSSCSFVAMMLHMQTFSGREVFNVDNSSLLIS